MLRCQVCRTGNKTFSSGSVWRKETQSESDAAFQGCIGCSRRQRAWYIPETLPQALRGLADEPELPGPDASADELRAIRERNARRRDRAEREFRLSEGSTPRTLRDIDIALEAMARSKARDGETMEAAFARLMASRDARFHGLLEERERISVSGAGAD